jgi:nucleotide-binding universal stress UspA family protein
MARLVLLHVVQPPTVLADFDPALPVVESMVRSATRQLGKWKALVESRGLTAVTICLSGASPSEIIVAQAKSLCADYVVMGSHGHGSLYDLLVGSTTGGVLRRAACPVVVVPSLQSTRVHSEARAERFGAQDPLGIPAQVVPRQPFGPSASGTRRFAMRAREGLSRAANKNAN